MTSPEELEAKLQQMWLQVLPQMLSRVEVVCRASKAITAGTLTPDLCSEAIQEAHKLAGALGIFGLHQGSKDALKIEQLLESKTQAETQHAASLQFSQDEIDAIAKCVESMQREISTH